MSDTKRTLFDQSRAASGRPLGGRGRYVVKVDAGKAERVMRVRLGAGGAPTYAGAAGTGRLPVPDARVSKAGLLDITHGRAGFAAARGLGHHSVPMAMGMGDIRRAHKAGLLSPGAPATNSRALDVHHAGAIFFKVDLTDMHNLARQLNATAVALQRGHTVISRAVNHGMRKFQTHLKGNLRKWTGIRRVGRLTGGFRTTWSTPATMHAVLNVTDRHLRVTTADFGARWNRGNPGATHAAWGRPQVAVGTFMTRKFKPVFKKTGGKYPDKVTGRLKDAIAPLWGPNVAREIDRHRAEVEAAVTLAGCLVEKEAVNLMRLAITGSRR